MIIDLESRMLDRLTIRSCVDTSPLVALRRLRWDDKRGRPTYNAPEAIAAPRLRPVVCAAARCRRTFLTMSHRTGTYCSEACRKNAWRDRRRKVEMRHAMLSGKDYWL